MNIYLRLTTRMQQNLPGEGKIEQIITKYVELRGFCSFSAELLLLPVLVSCKTEDVCILFPILISADLEW